MVGVMSLALVGACLADIGAKLTDSTGKPAAARHHTCSHAADLGAFNVQSNTASHLCNLRLLQASRGAVIAGIGASLTCLNAVLE